RPNIAARRIFQPEPRSFLELGERCLRMISPHEELRQTNAFAKLDLLFWIGAEAEEHRERFARSSGEIGAPFPIPLRERHALAERFVDALFVFELREEVGQSIFAAR